VFLKRFYNETLAQASYLIGCAASGEALVIDPTRDIAPYVNRARAEGVRITQVAETHIHADFISGSSELAACTGARLLLSDEGGPEWRYAFAAERNAVLLHDGDSFMVGAVRVEVLHTPGHTPEHLSFLVTDTATANQPMGMVTGDFVFVGDVGRPDLLERAAGQAGSADVAARQLYHSVQRLKRYPDYLQLWPGHGAGSACGKALGAVPQTTLGYERLFNWAFAPMDERAFTSAVLAGQPDPPRYFAEMKRRNRSGPRVLGGLPRPSRLRSERVVPLVDANTIALDVRGAADYAAGHIPGTVNIPFGHSFITWAGWLVPYERDLLLITGDASHGVADDAARDLALIGLDTVVGYAVAGDALAAWSRAGRTVETVPRMSAAELAPRLRTGELLVIDVRGHDEWETGHLPGVANIPLGRLDERVAELPEDRPIVVQCQGGTRSAIAASVLQSRGVANVIDLSGGFAAWQAAGLPVERG
jgi:hydroxyacylglutathione hydrolase